MAKVTFSLDEDTVRTLRRVAERTRKPQSLVVREAVAEYAAREEKLPDHERQRRLDVLRDLKHQPVTASREDVDRELRELRASRKTGCARPSD